MSYSKISPVVKDKIRLLFKEENLSTTELSERFGIPIFTIRSIVDPDRRGLYGKKCREMTKTGSV